MDYILHTTVDITHTGQHRQDLGKEELRWKEQNFQTLLQTLGIRANINFKHGPTLSQVSGQILGFNTNNIINVWTFEFNTERDDLFKLNDNPIGYLIEDFDAIPYISGLDESMDQNYNVFVTSGPATNIVFHYKQ